MKKILILLSLSILLTSCFGKVEEKITLDKEDEKMIEEVLDITETKTEEEVIEDMEKEEKSEEIKTEKVEEEIKKTNTEEKTKEVKVEETKVEDKTEETKKEVVEITPEEEAENLFRDLLGGEWDVDDAINEVQK